MRQLRAVVIIGYLVLLCVNPYLCLCQSKLAEVNVKTQKLACKYLAKEYIPGMSISISRNDTLIFSKGYGFSDIVNQSPVDPSKTKFRMASITKTMTAATIARLSELGLVDLTQSTYHYLDSLPKKEFDFTIEEIGGHISGMRRIAGTEKYTCDNTYRRSDFYKVFAADALLFEPSTQFEYSNYGYKL